MRSPETRLQERNAFHEEICRKWGWLSITHGGLVKDRDSAQRNNLLLRVLVTDLEHGGRAPLIFAPELADDVCERDKYRVLSQLIATQLHGLQAGYA